LVFFESILGWGMIIGLIHPAFNSRSIFSAATAGISNTCPVRAFSNSDKFCSRFFQKALLAVIDPWRIREAVGRLVRAATATAVTEIPNASQIARNLATLPGFIIVASKGFNGSVTLFNAIWVSQEADLKFVGILISANTLLGQKRGRQA